MFKMFIPRLSTCFSYVNIKSTAAVTSTNRPTILLPAVDHYPPCPAIIEVLSRSRTDEATKNVQLELQICCGAFDMQRGDEYSSWAVVVEPWLLGHRPSPLFSI